MSEISAEVKRNKSIAASAVSDRGAETMELDHLQDTQSSNELTQDSQTPLFDDTQDSSQVSTETTVVSTETSGVH